ncbi:hypothetical protein LUZ62_086204 [Rhynchospora pubera]|uniref:Uncharacterized protein n=1 Tax=Rhynchospora pubera TaxID=906938 RepID=A0AAV8C881_9POAL|nr:hypothetical protein LUZ62_086204 [Rhynchospora pubera]
MTPLLPTYTLTKPHPNLKYKNKKGVKMEDFSFPTVEQYQDQDQDSHLHHLPFPHFTTSPLWFLPSVAPLEKSPYSRHRRSRSASDKESKKTKNVEQCTKDEEKMDMLWESFNEELIRDSHDSGIESTNGQLVHHRSPSLILFIKVVKRLLFLRKTAAKRRSSSSASVC